MSGNSTGKKARQEDNPTVYGAEVVGSNPTRSTSFCCTTTVLD